ncbi:MAG: TonB-dependent receptor [Candidatus Omnitrophica bacterium]|nr:TonB-dependent receptor [Candidatus Omnitrophota bacterium]
MELLKTLTANVNVLHSEDTTATPGGLTLTQAEARRQQAVESNVIIFDDETDQVSVDLIAGPWEGFSGVLNAFWRNRIADSLRSNLFTITPSRGLSLRLNHDAEGEAARNLLVGGIELMDDKATTGTRASGTEDESHRKGYGLYLEDTVTLWDRLSLVGGLRFDKFRYAEALSFPAFVGTLRFEGFSPKAGLTYALLPDVLDVFAAYSRPFKAPNVDDYSGIVPDFVGNIDLQPQQANTYEVGTRFTRAPVSAEATVFYIRTEDEILFNRLSGAFGQNENFHTRRIGAELAARLELPEFLRVSTTYTFVDAEFHKGRFSERTIPGTPEHLVNVGIGVSPFTSFWVNLDWQLVQDFYRINDFNNILPSDNYGVLNLGVRYAWRNLRAFATITNLTNEEYTAFQSSNASNMNGAGENPAPSTGLIVGVTVTF